MPIGKRTARFRLHLPERRFLDSFRVADNPPRASDVSGQRGHLSGYACGLNGLSPYQVREVTHKNLCQKGRDLFRYPSSFE